MRKVRITSEDGKAYRTKIVDEETGLDLTKNCTRVAVEIVGAEPIRAELELYGIDLTATADAKFVMRHPKTGELAEVCSITFADGETVTF